MELKEVSVSPFLFKISQPFALSSAQSGHFGLLSNEKAYALKPDFNASDCFNYRLMTISVPEIFPAKILQKNDTEIFDNASRTLMRELLLDASLGLGNSTVRPLRLEWSPGDLLGNEDESMLMCRTNVGGCKIMGHATDSGFNYCVANLNEICTKEVLKDVSWPIRSVSNLRITLNQISIQEMCWNNLVVNGQGHIMFATVAGKLYVVRLNRADDVQNVTHVVDFTYLMELEVIGFMKWHSFEDHKTIRSFLVVESKGRIILFLVNFDGESVNDIDECSVLFDHCDKTAVTYVEFEVHQNSIDIIVSKGSFMLGFKVDYEGKLMNSWNKYINGLGISGVVQIEHGRYLVTTLDFKMYKLHIETKNEQICFTEESLSYGNPSSRFVCYGLAASVNRCYYLIPTFPNQQFDHLSLRNPSNLHVYKSPLDTGYIKKLTNNPHQNLASYYDCLEVLRYKFQHNRKEDLAHFKLPSHDSIDKQFVFQLKTILAVYTVGTFPQTINMKNLVISLNTYRNLSKLLKICGDATNLTEFQIKSVVCMQKVLSNYISLVDFEGMENLRELIEPLVKTLLLETAATIEAINENCILCQEELEYDKLTCSSGHNLTRCIFSCIQLPLTNDKCCSRCGANALNDTKKLQSLLLDDLIYCPLCDGCFKTNFYF